MTRVKRVVVITLAAAAAFGGGAILAMHRADDLSPPGRVASRRDPIDARQLAHCRTITVSEPDCARAWDAERRRFFGEAS